MFGLLDFQIACTARGRTNIHDKATFFAVTTPLKYDSHTENKLNNFVELDGLICQFHCFIIQIVSPHSMHLYLDL